VPGTGGKSGDVVAIAWIPGFSSEETIATGLRDVLDFLAIRITVWGDGKNSYYP
jgi:ABC-type sugar transport system substrate-binding protein